jgi:SAM-dependent methyltransferase
MSSVTAARTTYDDLEYSNNAYSQTHPARLASRAILHGVAAADPRRARVLELGCGAGGNLIPMAYELPESAFVGIDLAATPIEKAREFAAGAGVTNVRFVQGSVTEIDASWGQFDFIIAHGLLSWVPEFVQDAIFRVLGENLAPHGVAHVSFNAYPGCKIREIIRDLMLFHARGATAPDERIRRAREAVAMLAKSSATADTVQALFRDEAQRVADWADLSVFHDDLAEDFHPFYFLDFVGRAAQRGLQFLGEASLVDNVGWNLTPEALAAASEWSQGDRLAYEQYLDFYRLRRFRHTLLCRAGIPLERSARPESLERLWVSAQAHRSGAASDDGVEYRGDTGARITTKHKLTIEILDTIRSLWPASEAFPDFADRFAAPRADIADLLLKLEAASMIELRGCPNRAVRAGERPEASAVARWLLGHGVHRITNLMHRSIEINDENGRILIRMLDGARTREELVRALAGMITNRTPEQIAAELSGEIGRLELLSLFTR